MSSETGIVLVPVHDPSGRQLGHLGLEMAHRLETLGMLCRGPDGDLRAADEEHVELVEEFLDVADTDTGLVPTEPVAPENMLPAEVSRRAEFDSDTGVGECVVRVEGLDTDAYLALFESFFASRRQGVLPVQT